MRRREKVTSRYPHQDTHVHRIPENSRFRVSVVGELTLADLSDPDTFDETQKYLIAVKEHRYDGKERDWYVTRRWNEVIALSKRVVSSSMYNEACPGCTYMSRARVSGTDRSAIKHRRAYLGRWLPELVDVVLNNSKNIDEYYADKQDKQRSLAMLHLWRFLCQERVAYKPLESGRFYEDDEMKTSPRSGHTRRASRQLDSICETLSMTALERKQTLHDIDQKIASSPVHFRTPDRTAATDGQIEGDCQLRNDEIEYSRRMLRAIRVFARRGQ